MTAYTPRPGDLARDADGEIWFVYADDRDPSALYAINAHTDPRQTGQPVRDVDTNWGPLRMEYRPA